MSHKYTPKEIYSRLEEEKEGVLGTIDKNSNYIRLRVMYYGIDNKFACYFMSTKDSPKIEQILTSPNISFLVFGLKEPYDKSWEVEIDGSAEIIEKKEEINYALKKLKERNPFADVAIESGITTQFCLIKLIPKIIRFRVYGEALKGESPTILKLYKDGQNSATT